MLASDIKAVPGRKTDAKDAEWIADLLRHGLVRGSFIPDRPQRELRELTRYRRSLIQQRSQVVNRIQKVLEGTNIKLASVVSSVAGISGRAMLAEMAKRSLRKKTQSSEEALHRTGRASPEAAPGQPVALPDFPGRRD